MSPTMLIVLNAVLAIMMYGIALSLKTEDFSRVLKAPRGPITGLFAQFVVLPALTWVFTMMVPMPAEVALGLILVAACPGGSFSNIVTHLAGGNTAMSVSMTAIASLLASVMTPLNFVFYSQLNPETAALMREIAVPAENIFVVVALVLGLPLALGLYTGKRLPAFALRTEKFFRLFSLCILILFVASALIGSWERFAAAASVFLLTVVVHNAMALAIGNLTANAMSLNKADTRAITLEVGLQNSGLGLGIIFTFFNGLDGMAVIAAAWGICHLVSGLGLVWFWNRCDKKKPLPPNTIQSTAPPLPQSTGRCVKTNAKHHSDVSEKPRSSSRL